MGRKGDASDRHDLAGHGDVADQDQAGTGTDGLLERLGDLVLIPRRAGNVDRADNDAVPGRALVQQTIIGAVLLIGREDLVARAQRQARDDRRDAVGGVPGQCDLLGAQPTCAARRLRTSSLLSG